MSRIIAFVVVVVAALLTCVGGMPLTAVIVALTSPVWGPLAVMEYVRLRRQAKRKTDGTQ